MNKLIIPIIVIVIIVTGIGVYFVFQKPVIPEMQKPAVPEMNGDVPYYFIAIHNEPYHFAGGEKKLAQEYNTLKRMIAKADQYNIKLTLMFTAQWADYISASSERMAELELWKKHGHEIAAHHHSIYHGNWDGYTNYTKEEAEAQRIKQGKIPPEQYLGTLNDFIKKLKKINPNIKSCCCNEEHDKKEMPDEMIYATCSGFANCGEVGTKKGDAEQGKGRNEYVLTGIANDILRKWLTHYQITDPERQKSAQTDFDSTNSHIYGVVTHSASGVQEEEYYNFLEFLHSRDPEGKKSRTVSEIMEQKLLPEKTISTDLLNQKFLQPAGKLGKCGDGVCDSLEKANPNLCPKDCQQENQEKKVCEDLCGDGICQEVVCMAIGCPCPETQETCPSDCK